MGSYRMIWLLLMSFSLWAWHHFRISGDDSESWTFSLRISSTSATRSGRFWELLWSNKSDFTGWMAIIGSGKLSFLIWPLFGFSEWYKKMTFIVSFCKKEEGELIALLIAHSCYRYLFYYRFLCDVRTNVYFFCSWQETDLLTVDKWRHLATSNPS